jgi:predicted site-specific integrase-resolvase
MVVCTGFQARGGVGFMAQNLDGKNGQLSCAIYCRVSTNDQNCDRQKSELQNFAGRCGYHINSIHLETASGAKNDRLERAKVMNLAKSRQIKIVLVSELTAGVDQQWTC